MTKHHNVAEQLFNSLSHETNAAIFIELVIKKTEQGFDDDRARVRHLDSCAKLFLFLFAIAIFITSLAIAASVSPAIWAPILIVSFIVMCFNMPGGSYDVTPKNVLGVSKFEAEKHLRLFTQPSNPYGANQLIFTPPSPSGN